MEFLQSVKGLSRILSHSQEFMNDSSRDPTQLFVCEMDYIGYA